MNVSRLVRLVVFLPVGALVVELNERSLSILEAIVEGHIASGEPMGSRTIAKQQKLPLSPATVRNVMSDLEEMGYIVSPHTSAGRVPTDKGYRFYVDTLLQVRNLSAQERHNIESHCQGGNLRTQELLKQAGRILSNMSSYTGIVLAPCRRPANWSRLPTISTTL